MLQFDDRPYYKGGLLHIKSCQKHSDNFSGMKKRERTKNLNIKTKAAINRLCTNLFQVYSKPPFACTVYRHLLWCDILQAVLYMQHVTVLMSGEPPVLFTNKHRGTVSDGGCPL